MFVAYATNILCHWTYYEKWQRWASRSTSFLRDGQHSAEKMWDLHGLPKLIICQGRTHWLSEETRYWNLRQTRTEQLNYGLLLTFCFQASQSEWPLKKMRCSFEKSRGAELSTSFELSTKDAAFFCWCGEQDKRGPGNGGRESDGNCSLFAISICLGGVSMTLL